MRFVLIILVIILQGCSSPKQDDYIKHVSLKKGVHIDPTNFKLKLVNNSIIDLRALYNKNEAYSSAPGSAASPGGGVVGLITTMAIHASVIDSERNSKIDKAQIEANSYIEPLLAQVKDIKLTELSEKYETGLSLDSNGDEITINARPIFFSNKDMNQLSLKLIVWIEEDKDYLYHDIDADVDNSLDSLAHLEPKYKYSNLIHIYSKNFTEKEVKKLKDSNGTYLRKVMSLMLKTSIYIAKNDLTGKYQNSKASVTTHLINDGNKNRVVRGSILEKRCGFNVLQDIHSWLIAYPMSSQHYPEQDNVDKCGTFFLQ